MFSVFYNFETVIKCTRAHTKRTLKKWNVSIHILIFIYIYVYDEQISMKMKMKCCWPSARYQRIAKQMLINGLAQQMPLLVFIFQLADMELIEITESSDELFFLVPIFKHTFKSTLNSFFFHKKCIRSIMDMMIGLDPNIMCATNHRCDSLFEAMVPFNVKP